MRLSLIVVALSCLVFTSCNSGTNPGGGSASSESKPKVNKGPAQSKLSAEGTQALVETVNKYYALKNALVATRSQMADSAAGELVIMAENLKKVLAKDSSFSALKPYVDTIIIQGAVASGTHDETCEKQRLAFGAISSAMYNLLKHVELKNAGIYHEFCPMAFNDKGAFWLSDESDIKNPYFGKKMLECGEVTDSF